MSAVQITPFGIVIIAVYSFAISLIAFAFSRVLAGLRWRWWLLAPLALGLMALPWAEEGWIAWHFNEACKDAGVKVVRRVTVPGYLDATAASSPDLVRAGVIDNPVAISEFSKDGFQYKEYLLSNGKVSHIERSGVALRITVLDRPMAQYRFQYAHHGTEQAFGWKLEKIETQIVDSANGDVLARDIHFKRRSSVAEGLWKKLLGPDVTICEGSAPKPPELRHLLYRYVLIPDQSNQ